MSGRFAAISAAMAALGASTLLGQADEVGGASDSEAAPREGCFRGRPLPECTSFWLFEFGGQVPLLRSVRLLGSDLGPGPPVFFEEPFHQWSIGWDVGFAFNVSERNALGGSVGIEVPRTRYFLRGRYRRWLTDQGSLELVPGVFSERGETFGRGSGLGTSFGVRYNVSDLGYLQARYDVVFTERGDAPFTEAAVDPGGTGHGLYFGAGLGSTSALWGTGALGAAYLVILAVFIVADGGR
ncbi:MAG: hypothetical protein ACR2QM_00985 [Longimicrobiales bacterium]